MTKTILLSLPFFALLIAGPLAHGKRAGAPKFNAYGWVNADGEVRPDAVFATVRNLCERPVDVRICPGDKDDCGGNRNIRPWSTRKPGWNDAYGVLPDFTTYLHKEKVPFHVWMRTAFQNKSPEGPWHMVRELPPGTSVALDVQKGCQTVKPRPPGRAWGCYEWSYAGECGLKSRTTTGPLPEVSCAPPPSVEGDPSNLVCEVETEAGLCRVRYEKLAGSCLRQANTDGSWGGNWELSVRNAGCGHDLTLYYETAKPGTGNSFRITTGTNEVRRGNDAPLSVTLKTISGTALEKWEVPRGTHGFVLKADCSGLTAAPTAAGVLPAKRVPSDQQASGKRR